MLSLKEAPTQVKTIDTQGTYLPVSRKGDLQSKPVTRRALFIPHRVPRAWCKQVSACVPCTSMYQVQLRPDIWLGCALLSDHRPTECWATFYPPSVSEAGQSSWASTPFRGKLLRQVFIQICICIYGGGRHAVGTGAFCCSCSWGWGQGSPEAQLWVVCAFQLCCHLCGRAIRCGLEGGQKQESLRTFLAPAPESPVRYIAGSLHLKK